MYAKQSNSINGFVLLYLTIHRNSMSNCNL